jgi:UDP-N-acetylmuramoylalanine--D-glutamate ligase
MNYQDKIKSLLPSPVGIMGFGLEGQSTLDFLLDYGVTEIVVMDANGVSLNPELLEEFPSAKVSIHSGENWALGMAECASVIRSAGVPPKVIQEAAFDFSGVLSSQVELFFELYKGDVIAITGTYGKGSTLALISNVLKEADLEHEVGGNYGIPALDLLHDDTEETELCLLELSSFQLMNFTNRARIAVLLEVTSEHLDWHTDVEEYRNAKANLFNNQSEDDLCVYFDNNEICKGLVKGSKARKVRLGANSCSIHLDEGGVVWPRGGFFLEECLVKGAHQMKNMAVAVAVARELGIEDDIIEKGLTEFEGLPMRLQFKGKIDDVSFYNDSYATRPEAALAAVEAFENSNLAVVLGGSDKGADYGELTGELANRENRTFVALIGNTKGTLKESLELAGYRGGLVVCESLEEAFEASLNALQELDLSKPSILTTQKTLVLSPACASFGLFKNYVERGQVFDSLVEAFKNQSENLEVE